MPSNTNSSNAPGAQAPSQLAYQPPAYIYQLASQGLSLTGSPLTEAPALTWRKEVLKHWDGKSNLNTEKLSGSGVLTAEQMTSLRAKSNGKARAMGGKQNRVKEAETAKPDKPEAMGNGIEVVFE